MPRNGYFIASALKNMVRDLNDALDNYDVSEWEFDAYLSSLNDAIEWANTEQTDSHFSLVKNNYYKLIIT